MKEITNRADVRLLVDTFYGRIRADSLLGPIFNGTIPEERWPEHLTRLTDFWETHLFGIPKFKGNPSRKHAEVDQKMNYTMSTEHFDHWLELWFSTVDSLYTGQRAERAKLAAQRIAMAQMNVVEGHRPT